MESEARRSLGVYATPPPLVSFVVRSVHHLLQTSLGLEDGLADRRVRLLDPAAGALNFVIEAWRVALGVYRETRERSPVRFVREHLLPHFHGIEIRPEACEEGQRTAACFFEEEGCPLGPSDRACLHPADALAGPVADLSDGIPVVIGNPPWSGFRAHRGTWIRDLMRGYVLPGGQWREGYDRHDGERLPERNTKWLQDDYVKFLRLAQWTVEQAGRGVVGLVVNHNCLDAPTFAGFRRSLERSFEEVYSLDLHGNRRKGEQSPDGGADENVFPGIAQGAAVLLMVKTPGKRRRLFRGDLLGSREAKLATLSSPSFHGIPWVEIPLSLESLYKVQPLAGRRAEYERGASLPEIFPVRSLGVVTGRDSDLVAVDRADLVERFPAREAEILPFLVRPFDRRYLVYAEDLLARPRRRVMGHLRAEGNVALLAFRQAGSQGAAGFVTRDVPGHKVLTGYSPNSVFPLYLLSPGGGRVPNVSAPFRERLGDLLGALPSPEDILSYVYSILYHPGYRARYQHEIWQSNDFPRIPWPAGAVHFRSMSHLGRRLVSLHLLQGVGGSRLEEPLSSGPWREAIPPEEWSYRIGGYPVLERWLQARAGWRLSSGDREELGRIREALRRTLEIQKRLAETWD